MCLDFPRFSSTFTRLATLAGHAELLEVLLAARADVHVRDRSEWLRRKAVRRPETALRMALTPLEAAQQLLEALE